MFACRNHLSGRVLNQQEIIRYPIDYVEVAGSLSLLSGLCVAFGVVGAALSVRRIVRVRAGFIADGREAIAQHRYRALNHPSSRFRAQRSLYARSSRCLTATSNLVNILMMAWLERRAEILRMQIADQRRNSTPMPQRKAAVEQCERRVGIVLLARTMRKSGGLNARRRHDRFSARPPCANARLDARHASKSARCQLSSTPTRRVPSRIFGLVQQQRQRIERGPSCER